MYLIWLGNFLSSICSNILPPPSAALITCMLDLSPCPVCLLHSHLYFPSFFLVMIQSNTLFCLSFTLLCLLFCITRHWAHLLIWVIVFLNDIIYIKCQFYCEILHFTISLNMLITAILKPVCDNSSIWVAGRHVCPLCVLICGFLPHDSVFDMPDPVG